MKKTLLVSALLAFAAAAQAQSYPNKPIRWVIPYTPGGITDNVTRLVTLKMQEADKVIKSADMKARFDQLGIFPGGGTPEQAGKFLADEIAKWARVITTAGVKAEQ